MQPVPTIAILLGVYLLLSGSSCSSEQKSVSTESERLAAVYAQLLLLHERLRTQPPQLDTIEYRQRLQRLLDSTKYTEELLVRDLEREVQTMEGARRFYERVATLLEQRRNP